MLSYFFILLTMFISMYTIFNHYITSDIVGGSEATALMLNSLVLLDVTFIISRTY